YARVIRGRIDLAVAAGVEELDRVVWLRGLRGEVGFSARREQDADAVLRAEIPRPRPDADAIVEVEVGSQVSQHDAFPRVAALLRPGSLRARHLRFLTRPDALAGPILDVEVQVLIRAGVLLVAVVVPGERDGDRVFIDAVAEAQGGAVEAVAEAEVTVRV